MLHINKHYKEEIFFLNFKIYLFNNNMLLTTKQSFLVFSIPFNTCNY